MSGHTLLKVVSPYAELDEYFKIQNIQKVFLVCGRSIDRLELGSYFETLPERLNISVIRFSDFQPNPIYESVVKGVALFRKEGCDLIAAVGGGSAMDVAKCIKLYSNMIPDDGTEEHNYLNQTIVPNDVPLLAVPTTAGTGSEATRYAVIYYQGSKQSVADDSIIPGIVLLDPSVLKTLPLNQKKATMMDAFCHAIESFWSVNSTEESKAFSREALQMILYNKDAYLRNKDSGNAAMLKAASIAGKAINITQTTAGHAMCYKLTSLYGVPHGQAAAMVDVKLFPYMISHLEDCIDPRGSEYLKVVFGEIADAMGCANADEAAAFFQKMFDELELNRPWAKDQDYEVLRNSVNPVRLKNNPVKLSVETIDALYHEILA